MSEFVIDSGVLVKTVLPEAHSDAAVAHFKSAAKLVAQDLIWIEASNVLWKRQQRGQIAADELDAVLEQILRAPIGTIGSFNLVRPAAALAAKTSRTVYDCMYLALAIRDGLIFLTADERFVNSLRGTDYARHIRLLGA